MIESVLQRINDNMNTKNLKKDRQSCNTCIFGLKCSGTDCPKRKRESCFKQSKWKAGNNFTGVTA